MRKLLALIALIALSAAHAQNTDTSGGKNLDGAEQMHQHIEAGLSFSSAFLANDADEFATRFKPDQALVHVDFDSTVGKAAPVASEGNNFAVSLNGDAHVVASYQDLPATYWFGDQAESTFVLANVSVQIVFPDDISTANMQVAGDEDLKKLRSTDTRSVGQVVNVTLIDAHGNMMGEDRLLLTDSPAFLGILSDIPFRSLIISSTAETWMFSNLNYAVNQDKPMLKEGNVISGTATADEEKLTSCRSDISGNTELYKSGTVTSALGVQPICANISD